jgi:coenzyme F420 hydrogenase subunit beta
MSRSFENVVQVASWRLCLGCGACVAVCPNRALSLVDIEEDGLRPRCNADKCEQCGECLRVCPGIAIDAPPAEDTTLPELHRAWGPVLEVWEGYARDPEVRFCGSSGGVATALSLYCVEKARMQGVLHIGPRAQSPLSNVPVVSRTRHELLTRTGSRYAPAAPCSGFGLLDSDGPGFVFVGKPCDVVAVRKWQIAKPETSGRIALTISIFCAGTPSTQGSIRILEKLGVPLDQVAELRYRGCGWPGRTVARTRQNDEGPSMTYEESWGEILSRHTQFRCRLCPDSTGELADISCGDPWYRQIDPGDPGRSLVLVRTPTGRQILHEAMQAGYVHLEKAHADTLPRSQQSLLQRRQHLWGRLLALQLLRTPVPRYRGFSLFANWRSLPIRSKMRSVLGTLHRIHQRGWNKPLP